MSAYYKVIDLTYFYWLFPRDKAYLILHTSDNQEENITKKIRVSSRRLLNIEYSRNQGVQLLLKNDTSDQYDVVNVPYNEDVYKIDAFLRNIYGEMTPIMYSDWVDLKNTYSDKMSEIMFSDCAVIRVSHDRDTDIKSMQLLGEVKIQDTQLRLEEISYVGTLSKMDGCLFDKCLNGEEISVGDFASLLEEKEADANLYIDFDSLHFSFTNVDVTIRKTNAKEEFFACTLSKESLGMPSAFFAALLNAASEKRTLQFLSEYFPE